MSDLDSLIPRSGLQSWHEADNITGVADGGNVTAIPDRSEFENSLAGSATYPTFVGNALNGQPAVDFSGASNPLGHVEAIIGRHFFVVGSYTDAAFAADPPGLLTDQTALPVLVGNALGNTFIDLTSFYGSYIYKRRDVVYSAGAMAASMSGAYSIFEIQIPTAAVMDGLQIGQDRSSVGRKWKGRFVLDMIWDRVLSDQERLQVYEYIAMKYLLWKRNAAGLDVFPFQPDWQLPLSYDKRVLSSTAVDGTVKARQKSVAKKAFEPHFETRWPEEFDAAKAFWDSKYPGTSFVYRDYSFTPERDSTVRFTTGLPHQGNGPRDIDYSFQLVEA